MQCAKVARFIRERVLSKITSRRTLTVYLFLLQLRRFLLLKYRPTDDDDIAEGLFIAFHTCRNRYVYFSIVSYLNVTIFQSKTVVDK